MIELALEEARKIGFQQDSESADRYTLRTKKGAQVYLEKLTHSTWYVANAVDIKLRHYSNSALNNSGIFDDMEKVSDLVAFLEKPAGERLKDMQRWNNPRRQTRREMQQERRGAMLEAEALYDDFWPAPPKKRRAA